jgi:uncharacterized protein (DUF488 family)
MKRLVYTLGTDRRDEEDFVEIMNYYLIEAVIDVRRFPTSKFEIYKKENLQKLLSSLQIEYHFLGALLGGYRRGGYTDYMKTEDFIKGIQALEEIAKKKVSVVLCAEKFPWRCHRRWIARVLQKRGWEVVHIIDKAKEWRPRRLI